MKDMTKGRKREEGRQWTRQMEGQEKKENDDGHDKRKEGRKEQWKDMTKGMKREERRQ
jgi:hypothetical protein